MTEEQKPSASGPQLLPRQQPSTPAELRAAWVRSWQRMVAGIMYQAALRGRRRRQAERESMVNGGAGKMWGDIWEPATAMAH